MEDPKQEEPKFDLSLLGEEKGEPVPVPELGLQLEVVFKETPVSQDSPDLAQLKDTSKKMFRGGFIYLFDLMGGDFPYVSKKFVVKLTKGESHKHQGILMHLVAQRLREVNESPGDQYKADLEQSLVLHEILHNITDDEDFPMFAEMIYMKEKGNEKRIREIKRFFEEGELAQRHQKGLGIISQWLGYDSPSRMLDTFQGTDVESLKKVFREKLEAYCKEQYWEKPKRV